MRERTGVESERRMQADTLESTCIYEIQGQHGNGSGPRQFSSKGNAKHENIAPMSNCYGQLAART